MYAAGQNSDVRSKNKQKLQHNRARSNSSKIYPSYFVGTIYKFPDDPHKSCTYLNTSVLLLHVRLIVFAFRGTLISQFLHLLKEDLNFFTLIIKKMAKTCRLAYVFHCLCTQQTCHVRIMLLNC